MVAFFGLKIITFYSLVGAFFVLKKITSYSHSAKTGLNLKQSEE